MKIAYIADIRLPTEKAHGIQIMETCAALAKTGHSLTLYISSRDSGEESAIFSHYDLRKNFEIKKVPSVNLIGLGSIGFKVANYLFAKKVQKILDRETFDCILTRDYVVADILANKRKKVVYEIHDARQSNAQKRVLKKVSGIIAISKGLADHCISQGVDASRILLAPDAVNLDKFNVPTNQTESRDKLGLPQNKKIILYWGHLYSWKGADVLAEAASLLGPETTTVIVGGNYSDVKRFREKFGSNKNLLILGFKQQNLMPYYMSASNVLVLPNSTKENISRLYTSPLKLFEYMTSNRTIVASDLPSLREILNQKNAIFFEPDDPKSLAETIRYVLDNPTKTDKLAEQAYADVSEYTWNKRAQKILDFVSRS